MRGRGIAILALVACGGVASAATPHVDDFAVGAMNWGVGPAATPPEWQANGGPLGDNDGYLRVFNSTHLSILNTSAPWTGDYAAIEVETISVDMRNEPGSANLQMRLVLFGAGSFPQSADRWTSAVPAVVPADGVWRNYTFSVAEMDLTHVLGSKSYEAAITNIVQVMLRHDAAPPSSGGDSVSATLGIDNVRLAAAPLPGDYNRDGDVDSSDYHTWRGMFGATDSAADGNASGRVDAADYVFWRDRTTSGVAETVAVPEGSSLSLAGLATYVAALFVKRQLSGK